MKVMVTGSTGFIGRAVVERLARGGDEVVAVDINKPEAPPLGSNFRTTTGDIRDREFIRRTLRDEQPDCVVHLAYARDIARLESDPLSGVPINVEGYISLMEDVAQAAIRRFVWASSTAVYGSGAEYPDTRIDESARPAPSTIYGAYKAFNEFLADWFAAKYGLTVLGLRPGVVYGPGRWFAGFNEFSVKLFTTALRCEPYKLAGPEQVINWVYIRDLAHAFWCAVHSMAPKAGPYNIIGQELSLKEAAAIVEELCPGADTQFIHGGVEQATPTPLLSGTAAKAQLGYSPEFPFRRGAEDYLDWMRRHPEYDPE